MDNQLILSELLKKSTAPKEVETKSVTTSVESEVTRTVIEPSTNERERITATVTKEEKRDYKIQPKKPTAWVSVEFGANINLGNYNMGKVKVSIALPTGAEDDPALKAEIDKTYTFANAWVSAKVEEEAKKLLAMANA